MRGLVMLAAAATLAAVLAGSAGASHSWGTYHWARTANPFTVKVINANTVDWHDNLRAAIGDWNASSVMNVVEEAGSPDKRCRAVTGKVKSCNGKYGFNGWLGIAQIWASNSHITQGVAKMNDSYLVSYTETARQHVMCQELGHDWGLGHQDESGADLGTCMDYARSLDNPDPNQHDYQQLETIYAHLDATTTLASVGLAGDPSAAPVRTERDDRISSSTVTETFGDGTQKVTHVLWALGHPRAEHPHHD